ncbi:MAG: BMP family lipoprotein [Chloroflexota bacterium]
MSALSRTVSFSCLPAFALLVSACASSASPPAASPTPRATTVPTPGYAVTHPTGKHFTATLVTDIGGVHDRSFNQLTWHGLQVAHARLKIVPHLVQSKTQSQYLPNLVRSAQRYSALTIGIGYSMGHAMYTAAQEFPKARFAIMDARPLDDAGNQASMPNVTNLLFKEEESGYLVGVIAGLMEKDRISKATHNTIGYVGGLNISAVDHYLAGYIAGAKSVDPSITIIGSFANSFSSPTSGASIATDQINKGADILFQVAAATGVGYLGVAQQRGVYGIGSDTDQSYLGGYVITSALKRVNVAVRHEVARADRHKFKGGDYLLGAKQHATGFAHPSSIVPASIVAQAVAVQKQIASGAVVPPTTMPAG